jgi:hypothetical protein
MTTTRPRSVSLLELAVAAVVLTLVIGVALAIFVDANRSVGESMQLTDTALGANRLDGLLTSELRDAGPVALGATNPGGSFSQGANGLSPGGYFTSVQYRRLAGVDTTSSPPAPVFGALREIRFAYDEGEAGPGRSGDDLDNDADKRIDEGSLYLFTDDDGDGVIEAREQKARLAGNVSGDDIAFSFASGQPLPQASDLDLRLTFTVLHPAGSTGTADGTNGVTRELRIPLRNK